MKITKLPPPPRPDVERKWVQKHFDNLDSYTSLDELAKIVAKAQAAVLSGEWRNIKTEEEQDYDDRCSFILVGERMETDAEQLRRIAEEESSTKYRETREKEEFERLKKKFGTP